MRWDIAKRRKVVPTDNMKFTNSKLLLKLKNYTENCQISYSGFFLSRTSLYFEQKTRSLGHLSSPLRFLYLDLYLSRTNSLVPSEFEIERVHCIYTSLFSLLFRFNKQLQGLMDNYQRHAN